VTVLQTANKNESICGMNTDNADFVQGWRQGSPQRGDNIPGWG